MLHSAKLTMARRKCTTLTNHVPATQRLNGIRCESDMCASSPRSGIVDCILSLVIFCFVCNATEPGLSIEVHRPYLSMLSCGFGCKSSAGPLAADEMHQHLSMQTTASDVSFLHTYIYISTRHVLCLRLVANFSVLYARGTSLLVASRPHCAPI